MIEEVRKQNTTLITEVESWGVDTEVRYSTEHCRYRKTAPNEWVRFYPNMRDYPINDWDTRISDWQIRDWSTYWPTTIWVTTALIANLDAYEVAHD